MQELLRYVLVVHRWDAAGAAVLFAVGLVLAIPVTAWRLRFVEAPPLALWRGIMRLIGPAPGIARMTAVIGGFNSVAIFVYMSTGFHPLAPTLVAVWTGLNLAIVARRSAPGEGGPELACPPGGWRPSPRLTVWCMALTFLLELPCFWYALGMGIRMGVHVQTGAIYAAAWAPRAEAYAQFIVPVLFASALIESIAVRGMAAQRET